MAEKFQGEVRVASRIVDQLSSGLYHTPAACLKELINNSYDAAAQTVRVFVKPDADRIVIADDGDGFNRDEFQQHFDRVSESHKRDSGETTKWDRLKIGKIGIGFIAANELCETLEIISTKRGSKELLHVEMNFDEMKKPIEDRRDEDGSVVKADYHGEVKQAGQDEHFTQLHLLRVRGDAKRVMAGATEYAHPDRTGKSLYGQSVDMIRSELANPNLKTWEEFDLYSKTMLEIALNIPIRYHDNWIPKKPTVVSELTKWCEDRKFCVLYDNTELRKPVLFNPPGRSLVSGFRFDGDHVSARGYFYAQHGSIKPQELQGALIRIRGAAVGEYDSSFLGFSSTEASMIQRWISCEIWADDGLEPAMNIDRRTLREIHPAYIELREFVHSELRTVLKKARSELYEKGAEEKRASREAKSKSELKRAISQISPSARKKVEDLWKPIEKDEKAMRQAMKNRSVAEIYELVIQVANETLTPADARKFIRKLTEKLID